MAASRSSRRAHCRDRVRWCRAVALASVLTGSSPTAPSSRGRPCFPVLDASPSWRIYRGGPSSDHRLPGTRRAPARRATRAARAARHRAVRRHRRPRRASCCPAWRTWRCRRWPRTSGSSPPRWRTWTTRSSARSPSEAVDEFGTPPRRRAVGDLRRPAALRPAERRARGAWPPRSPRPRRARAGTPAGCTTCACRPRRREAVITMLQGRRSWSSGPGWSWRSRSAPTWTARSSSTTQVHEMFRESADLPHRPLPRQGGGAEHPGVPVRQRAVRADLEPQLHRPHPDRHPRDPRAGPAGRLLRGAPAPTRTWSSPTCSR